MRKIFDLYVGDRQGRSHLPTSFVYDNWDKVFTGTKKQCTEFVQSNNLKEYTLIEKGKIPYKNYLPFQSAVIDQFQRICDHGIPVSLIEYGRITYQYTVTFSTGKSHMIKSTNADLRLSKGDKVKFLKSNSHIILI